MAKPRGARSVRLASVNDQLRASFWFLLEGDREMRRAPCILDTGAPVTIIPQRYWQRAGAGGVDQPDAKVVGLGGVEVPAKLAHVYAWITTVDEMVPPLAIPDCRVKLAHDRDAKANGTIPREIPLVLIGLGGGLPENLGLCLDGRTREAHLFDYPAVSESRGS